jgi:hypothetical protein
MYIEQCYIFLDGTKRTHENERQHCTLHRLRKNLDFLSSSMVKLVILTVRVDGGSTVHIARITENF